MTAAACGPIVSVVRALSENWRYPPIDDVGRDRPEPAAAAAAGLSPPRGRVRAARDRHRVARRAALRLRRLRRRPPAEVRTRCSTSRSARAAPAGPSAAGAASRTPPTAAPPGAARAARPIARGSRPRPSSGSASRPPRRRARRPRPSTCRPGPARVAVGGHAACEAPCADLALQEIRPDRSLVSALGKVAALRAQPAGPRMMLYTGGRLAPGVDAARRAARDGALRVADGLAAGAGLPGGVGHRRAGRELLPHARSRASTRRSAAGPPAPGVDVSRIPGAPPGPGARTHYAFDSAGPEGTLRVIVIDNASGSLAASNAHQNPHRGPGRLAGRRRCSTPRRAASRRS